MGKRFLLINPWIADFAAYDFWFRPQALLWLGRFLRDSGAEVSLLDCLDRSHPAVAGQTKSRADGTGRFLKTPAPKPDVLSFAPREWGFYGLPFDVFDAELESRSEPDAVFVTCSMTYWYEGAFEVIRRIKTKWPIVPVILGGRYATLCKEHAREHSGADHIICGNLDPAAADIISEIIGCDVKIPASFADFPMPAHDLHHNPEIAVITASRGCPCRCSYCVSSVLAPKFEQRSVDQVAAEIKYLVGRGARHFAFSDDALLFNANDFLNPLLERVIALDADINFYLPNAIHARLLKPETAQFMRRAGFTHIRIGFESADTSFQENTGGKVSTSQFEQAVDYLLAAGFQPGELGAYILCGHPEHTVDAIRMSMREAASAGVEPVLAEYSPIPGSKDFQMAEDSFKHSPASDPLLQNSSLILFQHPTISRSEFETLKNECKAIRADVRCKTNKSINK